MKNMICIICPRGCHLVIDDNMNVTGNSCPRGVKYAISEMTRPVRTLTTSIRVIDKENTLVSVKTSIPIPKDLLLKAMEEINKISVSSPCHIGQVIIKNILETGADVIITKEIE